VIGRIWAIALNTFREAVRQKVLYTLVFFTVILILFSLFLGQLSLGANVKIVKDLGLASIMLFGALMAVFMGVGLVFKEVDRRTIYTILSKPVSRAEFILGKFAGLWITIGLEVLAMTLLLFLVLAFHRAPLDWNLLKAVVLIYAELSVLIAVALVFSSYSSLFMSSLFCLSFLVVGHLTDDLAGVLRGKAGDILREGQAAEKLGAPVLSAAAAVLEKVSLDHFVINAKIVHGVPVSPMWVANSLFYGFCMVVVLLTLAVWLFRRKDLQ
jgi:ABC-type transport system involved in multi-copper enzyme maturation permease subunit